MRPQSDNWAVPIAYPAALETMDDGRDTLFFPDFNIYLIVTKDAVAQATEAVAKWLRHRALNNQLYPFASDPTSLSSGPIFMIPTTGWADPVASAVEDDDGDS